MKIAIENLQFAYNGTPALDEIDLELSQGEVLALVGPNGSGKSTLLKLISGMLKPKTGIVMLDGRSVASFGARELSRKLGALEQEHQIGFDFTVRELVSWGRIPHGGRFRRWNEDDEQAVETALKTTGLECLSDRAVTEISGGERQRVFLAMALAQQPEVLLLDEPTAHLDLRYQIEILDLVKDLARKGLSVIVAIHDLNLAMRIADRIAVLCSGELVAAGSPQEVMTSKLIKRVWGLNARIERHESGLWVLPEL